MKWLQHSCLRHSSRRRGCHSTSQQANQASLASWLPEKDTQSSFRKRTAGGKRLCTSHMCCNIGVGCACIQCRGERPSRNSFLRGVEKRGWQTWPWPDEDICFVCMMATLLTSQDFIWFGARIQIRVHIKNQHVEATKPPCRTRA